MMLRPSLPMILPLMSSEGSWTTVAVDSLLGFFFRLTFHLFLAELQLGREVRGEFLLQFGPELLLGLVFGEFRCLFQCLAVLGAGYRELRLHLLQILLEQLYGRTLALDLFHLLVQAALFLFHAALFLFQLRLHFAGMDACLAQNLLGRGLGFGLGGADLGACLVQFGVELRGLALLFVDLRLHRSRNLLTLREPEPAEQHAECNSGKECEKDDDGVHMSLGQEVVPHLFRS